MIPGDCTKRTTGNNSVYRVVVVVVVVKKKKMMMMMVLLMTVEPYMSKSNDQHLDCPSCSPVSVRHAVDREWDMRAMIMKKMRMKLMVVMEKKKHYS